jgi:hypothetical protein
VFALTKSFDDESEVEEAKDEYIELLKSGEDIAFSPSVPFHPGKVKSSTSVLTRSF